MTINVTLITPTCDRPAGIALMEQYIAEHTIQPDQWIVADGGQSPATLTQGQEHLHNPGPSGARNLAGNILAALEAARGSVVIIIEDDDYYAPGHIAGCLRRLGNAAAAGSSTLRYYNVAHRCHITMANRGAALCQTALRRVAVPALAQAAQDCYNVNSYGIDGAFWRRHPGLIHHDNTVVGIKGLPGQGGLGIGHRPQGSRRPWKNDPSLAVLREWIADAADNYASMRAAQ